MAVTRQLFYLCTLVIACMARRHSSSDTLQLVLEGKPKLCDAAIVRQTCRAMDLRNNPETVTASEIANVLSATRSSTIAALKVFDLDMDFDPRFHGRGSEGGDIVITCAQLCERVVASIPEHRKPPSSDVGCRHNEDSRICDMDLSPEALSMVKFSDTPHDFHAGHPIPHTPAYDDDDEVSAKSNPLSITGIKVQQKPKAIEVTWEQAQIKLANLFRIFPVTYVSVDDQDPPDARSSLMQSDEDEATLGCNRAHCYPLPKCHLKSLCGGCKACQKPEVQSPVVRPPVVNTEPLPTPSPPPITATPLRESRPTNSNWPEWRQNVEKISIKSQAYVSQAIRQLQRDRMVFQRWFGRDGPEARTEALRVLNSVSNMLSNVVYVKDSPECEQTTYAFVYPYGPNSKNARGQYRFYLCPLYFNVNEGEQIETLTHEGSHHAFAYTDDVCADMAPRNACQKAYGRPVCQQLALRFPQRAIKNADNFCYYINDLNR